MFRFENSQALWLLLLLPLLILFFLWGQRRSRKMLTRFGEWHLVKSLLRGVSSLRPYVKVFLFLLVIAFVVLTISRPQVGTKISKENRQGIEIVIALDISNSMLATDVAPSRLERSKMLVENLVNKFSNDKVGLVVFAGDAFVQLPITNDYVSAKMFLQGISPSLIATQGTDLARAIKLSVNSFTKEENVGRAIIVITDGEDHEGGAIEEAKNAYKQGASTFVLGVGDPAGSPIPSSDGGYIKDESGNVVMSALNEDMCKDVAKAGHGSYIHVDNASDVQSRLNDQLSRFQKGESQSVVYQEYGEMFQLTAAIALLLLIAYSCLMDAKNPKLSRFRLFGKNKR